jgi:SH3-like domain-containing protein
MLLTVVQDYTAQYQDPISGRAGQRLRAEREDDRYPGWWWCRGPDGKEGWVPESYLDVHEHEGVLRRDYNARELSASIGEQVTVLEQVAGWSRVTNQRGQAGWLPTHCLTTG